MKGSTTGMKNGYESCMNKIMGLNKGVILSPGVPIHFTALIKFSPIQGGEAKERVTHLISW